MQSLRQSHTQTSFHEIAHDLGVSNERRLIIVKCYKKKRNDPQALLNLITSPKLEAKERAAITGFILAVKNGAIKDKHLSFPYEAFGY